MNPGKLLFIAGISLAALGLLMWVAGRWLRLFRLPGDIAIEREGFSMYLPITTMILLSLLLSGIFFLVRMLNR